MVLISVLVFHTNFPFFIKKRFFEIFFLHSPSAHQKSIETWSVDIYGGHWWSAVVYRTFPNLLLSLE